MKLTVILIRIAQELDKIMQRGAAEAKLLSTQNMTRINEKRAARGAAPIQLPSEDEEVAASGGVHALVLLVERAGWDDFGFLVFRTDYRDEALWERFLDEWDPTLQEGLDAAPAGLNVEGIREKVYMKMVSDDCMADKIPEHIALGYRMFDEDDDIEPGLKTKMCLMVDEECMRSVTERKPGSVPFVKAVDVTLGATPNLDYPGVFKVAISSLLTEFYPALASCQSISEIAPAAGEIWKHAPGPENAGNEWQVIEALLNSSSGPP